MKSYKYFHLHPVGSIKKIFVPIIFRVFDYFPLLIRHTTTRDNSSGILYAHQQILKITKNKSFVSEEEEYFDSLS